MKAATCRDQLCKVSHVHAIYVVVFELAQVDFPLLFTITQVRLCVIDVALHACLTLSAGCAGVFL